MSPIGSEPYVLWSKRPGWEDLEPVPQNDAPDSLVPIAYDEFCQSRTAFPLAFQEGAVLTKSRRADRDAMDTFRAIVAKQERSERTLEITKLIIQMNPGHYTVW